MAFVALLAGGIVISISTCLTVWRHSEEASELNQEARAILGVLSRDIRGAYLGLYRNAGLFYGMPAGEDGRGDTLELTTESSGAGRAALLPDELQEEWEQGLRPPVTDYVSVRYELLAASGEQPAGLYRTTMVVPVAEPAMGDRADVTETTRELISTGVTGLRFDYFDGEQWWDQWDSYLAGNRLPHAVALRFVLTDVRRHKHSYETIIPIAGR
jgi:hypothetical protein